MIMYNKQGKKFNAMDVQVSALEKAGWSKKPGKEEPVKEAPKKVTPTTATTAKTTTATAVKK